MKSEVEIRLLECDVEKIIEKFFICGKNIVLKRLTPIAIDGKMIRLRIKD